MGHANVPFRAAPLPVDERASAGADKPIYEYAAFSRVRRAEIGHHHHIAGGYLLRYAQEASWREGNRRMSNGDQVNRLAGMAGKVKRSVDFTDWQRT